MVRAWFMDDSDADQRLSHLTEPAQWVSLDDLGRLGVLLWKFSVHNYEQNEEFKALKRERNYSYEDLVEVSPERLPDYEQKLGAFYEEHLHTDEEIRFVLAGSGYFDVRSLDDRWIRIEVREGDLVVLPAGIYHRFTLDSSNFIKALRLFVGEPVWTAHARSALAAPAGGEQRARHAEQRYRRSLARGGWGAPVWDWSE